MKRITIIIFSVLFIAIILFGCKDQEVNNNLKFTDTIHISGQDADIDAMGALNLKVIDSILIVSTKYFLFLKPIVFFIVITSI